MAEHMEFLARVSEDAANRLLDELMKGIRSLAKMPFRNPVYDRPYLSPGKMSYSNTFTNTAPVGGSNAANTGDQEAKAWRAALYLRLSKEDGDKEESESISNQRVLVTNHADKLKNITVIAEKVDDGWSAKSGFEHYKGHGF